MDWRHGLIFGVLQLGDCRDTRYGYVMAGVLSIKHVQATLVNDSKTVYGDLEAFHRVRLGVWNLSLRYALDRRTSGVVIFCS